MARRADSPENGITLPRNIGILTKTVLRSPVTHWLLHARLRRKSINDVVFVGDDQVHVKQIGREGHLEHVATKIDFDARIRAAKVFSNGVDEDDEDFLVKKEDGEAKPGTKILPPDFLVLALTTNDLVFLYLESRTDGTWHFVHQSCPLPTFDRVLYQPGHHLAIDPRSRALAVAANEREVIIYSAKGRDRLRHEISSGDENWCPVSAQRPLQVEGVIQHMDFLIPPEDDQDHIVLLLIVVEQRITKAIWIDWYYASDLHHATIHPGLPLSSAKSVPSLLIPLRNAAFMLVTGSEVRKYKGILSGAVTGLLLAPLDAEPRHAGHSPLQPIWASWCRPRRSRLATRNQDHIYLAREDGLVVLLLALTDDTLSSSSAGHLHCHVGTGFASLGHTNQPDILAVAGDMSTGCVVSIGHWPSKNGRVIDLDWSETMAMDLIETVPNWASSTDMITSALPLSHGRSTRSRDGILVTSGRQPYGSVTELRHGLEARLAAYFELDELHVVAAMWALPIVSDASLLMLLSTPTTTRFLAFSDDLSETAELDSAQASALDADHRTITAAVISDERLAQVTEKSICLSAGLISNFEDSVKIQYSDHSSILAAAIERSLSMLVTAELRDTQYLLRCIDLSKLDATDSGEISAALGNTIDLPSAPLALAVSPMACGMVCLVSTAEDGLRLYSLDAQGHPQLTEGVLPSVEPTDDLSCDHIVFLHREVGQKILALCGLRDGGLLSLEFLRGEDGQLQGARQHRFAFGHSTVRLAAMPLEEASVCAMSGLETCVISWSGEDAESLLIRNIWLSDKLRPELSQGSINACCQLPSVDFLPSGEIAGALAMISGNEFLVANVDPSPTTVPRQIPVTGTPNRLIYSEQQRAVVVASLKTAVRSFPTPHSRPEERRQIWPTIDFIPSRSDEPTFTYDLQPGERVYALLEWCYKTEDKLYSFILVGGSYIKRNGSQGGRVRFLQPSRSGWEITGATEGISTKFDAPVFALALFDDLTYVVCYGDYVCLYCFNPEERRWQERSSPLRMASPGVHATVKAPLIYVSTARDSLVTLTFDPGSADEGRDLPRLTVLKNAPEADQALNHVIVQPETEGPGNSWGADIALMSTKSRHIVGFTSPSPTSTAQSNLTAAEILFKAQLPHSLTRLRQADVRPRWKSGSEKGVVADNIIGIAADGALVGVALLDDKLWKRLSWLQRLCEWSRELSPHGSEVPPYSAVDCDAGYAQEERAMPVGISVASEPREIMLQASVNEDCDNHVDGDVLARVLSNGGVETVRALMKEVAEREDQVGAWMREHLEEELEAIDDVVQILRKLLDSWL